MSNKAHYAFGVCTHDNGENEMAVCATIKLQATIKLYYANQRLCWQRRRQSAAQLAANIGRLAGRNYVVNFCTCRSRMAAARIMLQSHSDVFRMHCRCFAR